LFKRLSNFLKDKTNRAILQWIGGGATVIIGGLWAIFVFFYEKAGERSSPPTTIVEQKGTGLASGGSMTINAPVTINPNAKEVAAPIEEQVQKLADQIAREKGVEEAPLRAVLAKFGEKNVPKEDIPKRLNSIADELVKYRNRTDSLKNGPPELAIIAGEAQALVNKGDFDGARATLAHGRLAAKKLRENADRREAEMVAQEASIDNLQGNYSSSATKYAEAANLVAPFDTETKFSYLTEQAITLANQGQELGDNEALNASIKLFQQLLAITPRERNPTLWAATQANLGASLDLRGRREFDTSSLKEAIVAYGETLKEWTRESARENWATIKNNVGNVWRDLGEREIGTSNLEQAIATYGEALKELTPERDASDWALTQNNLGIVLRMLGERESGTTKLEQAVLAFRKALTKRPRARVPLDWADTQSELGVALRILGERESGTTKLEQAVATFGEALKERTRARVPLAWADTQSELGVALRILGERESGTTKLEQAVAAFGEALKERTRERVPLDWAITCGDQGIAMGHLADRKKDILMADTAIGQIKAAQEVMRNAGREPSAIYYAARLSDARENLNRLKAR
jgi:tetratricopeptide (TPR) repeat protein